MAPDMRVATWHGGRRFSLDTVPDPRPGPGEVIVRVDTVGICGTDVHITQGLFPATPPAVLGHEFSGVVVDVGAGVSPQRVGEAVACDISSNCQACVECRAGRWNRCVHARKASGAFAELAVVPADCAHPVPAGLDLATAALTEPASCCLVGVEMAALPPQDSVVVVIGGGIMGLFTLAFARAHGARHAILSDPVPARRAMARRLGAGRVVDPGAEDLGEVVRAATDGRGAHAVFEAVGKPELLGLAVGLARPRGAVVMIGVHPPGSRLPADLYDLHWREIVLRGAFGRGDAYARTLARLPELRLPALISARYPLARVDEALAAAADGRGVKTALTPNAVD
jgi:threonine dehydrogenase-like Zn-dependent dehydrogenase